MQNQTIEKFKYTAEDIKNLILEDVRKHLKSPITKQRVKIWFEIGAEPGDDSEFPNHILKSAHIDADITDH
jgi:hypothetical protein